MPQLDSSIIFTQLFWLIIIFSLFYGSFLNILLPLIVKTLKLRNNLTELHQETKRKVNLKWTQFLSNYMVNLINCLNVCKTHGMNKPMYLSKVVQVDKNINFLKKVNSLFMYNIIK
uniref:ATP synthase F0 subunit 8 n=1 Tax=Pseudoerythrocladia kornmannii TaxID=753682 RepID=UPI001FCD62A4|nr:ATP synthase F0 subunit 8 [Pseudoerythrocladia kornmannii]UNJ19023.1 ATP synthase F0 subunit 8 [Pseudoerythrocladia kornmannii]